MTGNLQDMASRSAMGMPSAYEGSRNIVLLASAADFRSGPSQPGHDTRSEISSCAASCRMPSMSPIPPNTNFKRGKPLRDHAEGAHEVVDAFVAKQMAQIQQCWLVILEPAQDGRVRNGYRVV